MPGPAIWHGHISFGIISIPVRLLAATERGTTALRFVHTADGCLGRIRYRKFCEIHDQEIDGQDIGRGYETPAGIVPLTDTDLDRLPLATARTIELVAVVPADRIDPRQIGAASYFLGTTDTAPATVKPYVLLRETLSRTDRVVIVKYAVRADRERLGMLRPHQDTLALHGLRWPDEIRDPAPGLAPAPETEVDEDELAAALALIEARSVDTLQEIPDLTDRYARALGELVEAKLHDRSPAAPGPQPGRHRGVVGLMSALEASVRDARASRGEDVAGGGESRT